MSSYTLKRLDEMESIYSGAFRRAGAELGIESFGPQVFDMPAGTDNYPEHDHSGDGQEEVYVVLSGSAEFETDGDKVQLDPENIVRVAPAARRRVVPGPDGGRILALGGVPGGVYERPDAFRLGAPDPAAA